MSDRFDAYHELLGIPPEEQPPNHYRLLGVTLFESNKSVVSNAAARQMRFLRTLGGGDFSDISQKLLNEIAAAKLCLLDAQKRESYDQQLREQIEEGRKTLRESDVDQAAERLEAKPAEPESEPARDPAPAPNPGVRIRERVWVVGGSPECDIVVDREVVSRTHCRLTRTAAGFLLEDLGSTNGTYVNGVRINKPVEVRRRDRITLGKRTVLPWPDED